MLLEPQETGIIVHQCIVMYSPANSPDCHDDTVHSLMTMCQGHHGSGREGRLRVNMQVDSENAMQV